jgi:DNA-binding CsgD family transcriptional regulator
MINLGSNHDGRRSRPAIDSERAPIWTRWQREVWSHPPATPPHQPVPDQESSGSAERLVPAGREGPSSDPEDERARVRVWSTMQPHGTNRNSRPVDGWNSLTNTERRVANLVAEGLANREVAKRMFLSRHTVDYHLRHVYLKLNINSRLQLTRLIIEQGHDRDGGSNHQTPALHAGPGPAFPTPRRRRDRRSSGGRLHSHQPARARHTGSDRDGVAPEPRILLATGFGARGITNPYQLTTTDTRGGMRCVSLDQSLQGNRQ